MLFSNQCTYMRWQAADEWFGSDQSAVPSFPSSVIWIDVMPMPKSQQAIPDATEMTLVTCCRSAFVQKTTVQKGSTNVIQQKIIIVPSLVGQGIIALQIITSERQKCLRKQIIGWVCCAASQLRKDASSTLFLRQPFLTVKFSMESLGRR